MSSNSAIDPVTLEIILHRLVEITEEMGSTYRRCSGSAIITEANDMSTGIMTATGESIAIGPFITQQVNVLPVMVKNLISKRTDDISEGDVFICNDPYAGAIHQADVAILSPFFYKGKLVAWTATSGHQVDIGGSDPGSFSMRVVDIHQEGLRIPFVKIVENGIFRKDVLDWIINQTRDRIVGLDLKAQIAANHTARKRLEELYDKYGSETIEAATAEMIRYSETRFRKKLLELPDGSWRARAYIDHDGHSDNIYRIFCSMTKKGDQLIFDFEGTDNQVASCINCTYSGLIAGTLSATLILLCYDIPWNEGISRCLTIEAPKSTIVNCSYPTPCSMATLSASWAVTNTVVLTISKMLACSEKYKTDAMAVWCGSCQYPAFSGINQNNVMFSTAEMSHHAGSGGARTFKDGVDLGGVFHNPTPSIPNIETIEQDYPLLYLFRRQMRDSGGPGKFRGGVSGEICYTLYDAPRKEVWTVLVSHGAEVPPSVGISGGLPGSGIRWIRFSDSGVYRSSGKKKRLPTSVKELSGTKVVFPSKHPRILFKNGEVWYNSWAGGGGYGDPITRSPELVAADVRNGMVSREAAISLYGVVVKSSHPDEVSTTKKRLAIRKRRLDGKNPRFKRAKDDDLSSYISETLAIRKSDNKIICSVCQKAFCTADGNYKEYALFSDFDPIAVGAVKEKEYEKKHRCILREYYCPGCGTQLDAEVMLKGEKAVWDIQLAPGVLPTSKRKG